MRGQCRLNLSQDIIENTRGNQQDQGPLILNLSLWKPDPTQLGMLLVNHLTSRGHKQMRDKIITEAARVALARREFEESAADIQRKLNARSAILRRRYHVTD